MTIDAFLEFRAREEGGKFWVDLYVDRQRRQTFGSFLEQQRAVADMVELSCELGAKEGRPAMTDGTLDLFAGLAPVKKVEPQLDLWARQIVVASLLYYRHDHSFMTASNFDAICREVASSIDACPLFQPQCRPVPGPFPA